MTRDKDAVCSRCVHWDELTHGAASRMTVVEYVPSQSNDPSGFGYCLAMPPQLVDARDRIGRFPITEAELSCGQFDATRSRA